MKPQRNIFRMIFVLICIMVISGCTTQTATPAPTIDVNPLRTEIAKTVLAEVKQATVVAPPATPIPPTRTNTAMPPVATTTFTPTILPPTLTATLPPTATKPPVVFIPSNTPARSDVALWLSQRPADGATMPAGGDFDTVWRVKNVGRKNWSTSYYIKFQGGDNFATQNQYMLPTTVNTGDDVELVVDCIAPRQPGSYLMRWSLINDNGEAFYTLSVRIAVK